MAKHDGAGGLWSNQYKQPGDTKPDYIGEITIDGVTHKLAGWHNKSGNPRQPVVNLILSKPKPITPPCPCYEPAKAAPAKPPTHVTPAEVKDWDSDMPF